MKTDKTMSAMSGVKSEHVGFDKVIDLTNDYVLERYPICDEAQKVINALKPGCDKSSIYYLTECLRGFSKEMQEDMAYIIADVYASRREGCKPPTIFTGVFHVDRLLNEIIFLLDKEFTVTARVLTDEEVMERFAKMGL